MKIFSGTSFCLLLVNVVVNSWTATRAVRLGGWVPDSNCVDSAAPIDVVWVMDDNQCKNNIWRAVVDKAPWTPSERRHGIVKHNRRSLCKRPATDDYTYVINEEILCPKRAELYLSDADLTAHASSLMKRLDADPEFSDDPPYLMREAAFALVAGASSIWRPGSARIVVMYTREAITFGPTSDHACVLEANMAGTLEGVAFSATFCKAMDIPSSRVIIDILARNHVALVIHVDVDAYPWVSKSWEQFRDDAKAAGLPVYYTGVSNPAKYIANVWTDVENMARRLTCVGAPAAYLGELTRYSLAKSDRIGGGLGLASEARINAVILLDDQYGTDDVVTDLKYFYYNVAWQGFRFNKVKYECNSWGITWGMDRTDCGRPQPLVTQSDAYLDGDLRFATFDALRELIRKPVFYEPENFERAQDLVNSLYGSMLYPMDDENTRRIVIVYTRMYPGAPLFNANCYNRVGPNGFNSRCNLDGSGDFGEAWREIIEKGSYVLIIMARFADGKTLSGENSESDWKKGWENAINKVAVPEAKGRYLITTTSIRDAWEQFLDELLFED